MSEQILFRFLADDLTSINRRRQTPHVDATPLDPRIEMRSCPAGDPFEDLCGGNGFLWFMGVQRPGDCAPAVSHDLLSESPGIGFGLESARGAHELTLLAIVLRSDVRAVGNVPNIWQRLPPMASCRIHGVDRLKKPMLLRALWEIGFEPSQFLENSLRAVG